MRMLLALSASVAMAACATSSATPNAPAGPSVTPPPAGTVSATTPAGATATWRASLQGEGNSISGSATVSPAPSGSTANINIRDAQPGAVHPWHVHVGTCASGGGIAGPASAYSPLNVTQGGNANSSAALPMTLDPSQSYHVNVHNSPSDMGTIVACGDLHIVKS